jgi:transcription elongation GreA/GreB family factor
VSDVGDVTAPRKLADVAASGNPEALEEAWLEAVASPGPAEEFLHALSCVPEGMRGGNTVALLLLLLEAYQKSDSHADILAVARALHPHNQRKVDIDVVLREALVGVHGSEPWFELFRELAGFDSGAYLEEALDKFDQLMCLLPGRVVYHRSGWGEGLVTGHDLPEQSFHVTFREDGISRSMPFTTGLEVLTFLEADDLRARLLVDVEGLKAEAKESPALLVRAVTRMHKGRAGAKEIKRWLSGTVVAEKSWASWWKKAKAAAARDPYLAVENPSRPLFILRKRALSPEDEARAALERSASLKEALDVVRGPLGLDPEPAVKAALLEGLAARIDGPGKAPERVEAALLLARHGARPQEFVAEVVDTAVSAGSGFAELAKHLPEASSRRDALEAFVAARPQLWSDALIGELADLSPQLLDLVCERLKAEGRGDALANRFHIFLLNPSRTPGPVLRMSRHFAAGLLKDVEGAPTLFEVVMGLLRLAETQAPRAARGDKEAKQIMGGLEEVLCGAKRGLFAGFAKHSTRDDMATAMDVLTRVRQMPDEIATPLRRAITERFPDLKPKDELPFWHSNRIYCTREGIDKRSAEYNELINVKIPENSADIGRAAAYGDLSENYEWTAAIEQQRQLTEKAAAMEAELKLAQPLEDQELEAGVVSPGTRVEYDSDGQTQSIDILGPWDIGEGKVSYRAPLAAGMLGAKAGEILTVELPSGETTVTILSVKPALG